MWSSAGENELPTNSISDMLDVFKGTEPFVDTLVLPNQ